MAKNIDVLSEALEWLACGVSVVPVRERSKIAAVRWRRYQDTLPSEALVRQWFGNGRRNLGLVCGAVSGNLTVLDFDSLDTYSDWCSLYPSLVTTYTVATQRGCHVYLRIRKPPDRSFSLDGQLDIKCSGYVLGVPSVHPSGHRYEAIDPEATIRTLPTLPIARLALGSGCATRTRAEYEGGTDAQRDATGTDCTPILGLRSRSDRVTPRQRLYRGVVSDIKCNLSVLALAERHTIMRPADTAGLWFLGRCPDPQHEDRNPSFRVDAKRNYATCLTPACRLHCPRGLSVVDLYARLYGLTSRQAIEELAREVGT